MYFTKNNKVSAGKIAINRVKRQHMLVKNLHVI